MIGRNWEKYVKKLDSFTTKKEKNKKLVLDEQYDGISKKQNEELYNVLSEKIIDGIYKVPFFSLAAVLEEGKEKFNVLSLEDQVNALKSLILLLKCGRAGSCDLTLIGGKSTAGVHCISSKLSNLKKRFSDIRIEDVSPSGIFESHSFNLLDLLS